MGDEIPGVHADPRNEGFRWTDRPHTARRLLRPEDVNCFNQAGYCVVRNAVDAATAAALAAAIDPLAAEVDATVLTLEGGAALHYRPNALIFVKNVTARSPMVRDFCRSRLFRDIGHDLLGPNVRLYWDQAVYKQPRKGPVFPWHQDTAYTFTEPQDYVTCWLALGRAGIAQGCPWVVPGLHRQGTLAHELTLLGLSVCGLADDEPAAVPLELSAGDMAVFSALTPHRTGANEGRSVRKALIVQLMADGTAQVDRDGTRRPQDDPKLNMWVLKDGRAAAE